MLRLLILIFLLTNSISADWGEANGLLPFYVNGDVESVKKVIDINAMLTQDIEEADGKGTITWWVLFFAMLIAIAKAAQQMVNNQWQASIGQLIWMLTIVMVLFAPVGKIKIIDKRFESPYMPYPPTPAIDVVENVPLLLALIMSSASVIVNGVEWLVTDILYDYEDPPITSVKGRGFNGANDDMERLLTVSANMIDAVNDQNSSIYMYDMKRYMSQCAMTALYLNPTLARPFLYNPQPGSLYNDNLSPSSLGVSNIFMASTGKNCSTFWSEDLERNRAAFEAAHTKALLKAYNRDINTTDISKLDNALSADGGLMSLYGDGIGELKAGLRRVTMAKVTDIASKEVSKNAGYDAAMVISMEKAKQNMMMDGVSSMKWVGEMLPYLQHFFVVLVILLYFPSAIVAAFKGLVPGAMHMFSYFSGFLLILMLDPVLELIQYLTNLWGANSIVVDYSNSLFSHVGYGKNLDYLATMSGISSMFGLAAMLIIPGIVLKGQVSALASAAGNLKGMFNGGAVLETGGEALSDNYVKELHEQEKRLTQAKQNEGKSSALKGAGLSSGVSSAETDMMYANMQSQMNAMSGGMVMRSAVQNGDAGTLMRGAHYSAEKQMSASIGRVEELEAQTGSIEAAMATSVTAGRVAGIGEARSDVGTAQHYSNLSEVGKVGYAQDIQNQAGKKIDSGASAGMEFNAMSESGKEGYFKSVQNKAAAEVAGMAILGQMQTKEEAMGVAVLQAKMKLTGDNTDLEEFNKRDKKGKEDFFENIANQSRAKVAGMVTSGAKVSAHQARALATYDAEDKANVDNKRVDVRDKMTPKRREQELKGMRTSAAKAISQNVALGKAISNEAEYLSNVEASAGMSALTENIKGKAAKSQMSIGVDGMSLTKDYATGVKRSELANLDSTAQKAHALGTDGKKVSDEEYVKNIAHNALKQETSNQIDAQTSRTKLGDSMQPFANLYKHASAKKIDEFMGSAVGIANNESLNPGIYRQNANYGELSSAQVTATKIATKGGISGAVSTDIDSAKIAATKEVSGLKAIDNMESFLENISASSALDTKTQNIKGKSTKKFVKDKGDSFELDGNLAEAISRTEDGNLESIRKKSTVRGKDGERVSHDNYVKNVAANAQASENKSQIDGETLRKTFDAGEEGNKGDFKGFSKLYSGVSTAKNLEFIGNATGTQTNLNKDSSMYLKNAQYSEISSVQKTAASIDAQGGIKSAVVADVTATTLKASKSQASTAGELEQLAKKSGMSGDAAKEFTKAIMAGAKDASELMKQGITSAASNLAEAKSGASTAGDIAQLGVHNDSKDNFIRHAAFSSEHGEAKKVLGNFSGKKALEIEGAKLATSAQQKAIDSGFLSDSQAIAALATSGAVLAGGFVGDKLGKKLFKPFNPETSDESDNKSNGKSDGKKLDKSEHENPLSKNTKSISKKKDFASRLGLAMDTFHEVDDTDTSHSTKAKTATKTIGKSLAKKAPFGLGLAASGGMALDRVAKGDYIGAALDMASGVAAIVPGVGTAISFGIDAASGLRDMGRDSNGVKNGSKTSVAVTKALDNGVSASSSTQDRDGKKENTSEEEIRQKSSPSPSVTNQGGNLEPIDISTTAPNLKEVGESIKQQSLQNNQQMLSELKSSTTTGIALEDSQGLGVMFDGNKKGNVEIGGTDTGISFSDFKNSPMQSDNGVLGMDEFATAIASQSLLAMGYSPTSEANSLAIDHAQTAKRQAGNSGDILSDLLAFMEDSHDVKQGKG